MRYFKQIISILSLLLAIPSYAGDFISIPSTLFYNKLRFGMTPEMVGNALDKKGNKMGCRELPRDNVYFKSGLDQKICKQYISDDNGDNIEYDLYFTNNKLTRIYSFFKPMDKNGDRGLYFNKKVDSLRDVMKQANIRCGKSIINNSMECSFVSSIASINFTDMTSGVLISLRPPYLLSEEYERKEANGPVNILLYGLEVGKSNLDDLKNAARKNNWKVTEKEDYFNFNKPNKTIYIIKLQEPTDVHTVLVDFDGDKISKFTYWFIDPLKAGGKSVKADINYIELLSEKYGTPYDKPRDIFTITEWRVNSGYRNEVTIRTNQSPSQELSFISYADTRLDKLRNIQDINKTIDDLMKRFYGAKIEF